MSRRVLLLGSDGPATRSVYHALSAEFSSVNVVLEQPVPRWRLLRGRIRRLGLLDAAGQAAFVALASPLIARAARGRIAEIMKRNALSQDPIPEPVCRVSSVNSGAARAAIAAAAPDVVVVSGTRIIGRRTLETIPVPILNMHAGITPLYRGVHGGYWALAEGRPELVGTTIHLVDEGIDTGTVVAQATFGISDRDSFATYPALHLAAGLPLLIAAVKDALNGALEVSPGPDLPSKLRHHPTIWGYLWRRVRAGVR